MKNSILSIRTVAVVTLIILSGCQKKAITAPLPSSPSPSQPLSQAPLHTYASSRCFVNAIETRAALSKRYSQAEFTIRPDKSASMHLRTYTDAACQTSRVEKTIQFSGFTKIRVNGVSVLVFEIERAVLDPRWYLPVAKSPRGLYFDMEYADQSSGPYLTEPSGVELTAFKKDPSRDGVEFIDTATP